MIDERASISIQVEISMENFEQILLTISVLTIHFYTRVITGECFKLKIFVMKGNRGYEHDV